MSEKLLLKEKFSGNIAELSRVAAGNPRYRVCAGENQG
jgi:hypothetical protein